MVCIWPCTASSRWRRVSKRSLGAIVRKAEALHLRAWRSRRFTVQTLRIRSVLYCQGLLAIPRRVRYGTLLIQIVEKGAHVR